MAGAVLALMGAGSSAGGGGGSTGTLSWGTINGTIVGANAAQTISGITAAHSLTATISGPGALSTIKNGVTAAYTGAFSVSAGDTLAWQVVNNGKATKAGTITVFDATAGGVELDSFSYVMAGNGFQ